MPTLNLKSGVCAKGVQPELLVGILVAQSVFASHGFDCVITSLCDDAPNRKPNSRHKLGYGVDFRTKHLPDEIVPNLVAELKLRLTTDYDVVLEHVNQAFEHLHLEYDPKPKGTL